MYDNGGAGASVATGKMTAVVRRAYGTVEAVSLDSVPLPSVGPGHVLLAVHAAGVDRGTLHVMTGLPWLYRLVGGLRRPRRPVLGLDVCGEVRALGEGVTRFAVGDRVLGFAPGALAQYVVASQDKLTPMPPAWSPRRRPHCPSPGPRRCRRCGPPGLQRGIASW